LPAQEKSTPEKSGKTNPPPHTHSTGRRSRIEREEALRKIDIEREKIKRRRMEREKQRRGSGISGPAQIRVESARTAQTKIQSNLEKRHSPKASPHSRGPARHHPTSASSPVKNGGVSKGKEISRPKASSRNPSPLRHRAPAHQTKPNHRNDEKETRKGDQASFMEHLASVGKEAEGVVASGEIGTSVLTYSSAQEKKIVDAFLEIIGKQNQDRTIREQEERRVRGSLPPYSIPASHSPSSSFITMKSAKRELPDSSSTPSSPGSPPKKIKISRLGAGVEGNTENVINLSAVEQKWRGEGEGSLRIRQNKERKERVQLYGLDAELAHKTEGKLQPELVAKVIGWLEKVGQGHTKASVSGQQIRFGGDLDVRRQFDCLKSGRLLCGVVNKMCPGIVPKVHVRPIPLMEQENIKMYLIACERLGMRKADLFVVSDLYEEKYLPAVLQNIICLARIASTIPSFSGPKLTV